MWTRGWALGLGLLLFASGCDETVGGGVCAEDSQCPAGQTCLVDLNRGTSYCTSPCALDSECPAHQSCRAAAPAQSPAGAVQLCVDKVRGCAEAELCNGLDDDCDGVVDGAGCALVDRCLDDAPCGAWVCQAPENQPAAVCAPPLDPDPYPLSACTADDQCRNGVCESGFCSPLCRPRSACPAFDADGTRYGDTVCVRAVGDRARPKHNKCHIVCNTASQCPNDLACVWRDVFQGGDSHEFVCAVLDPERKDLGAACTDNQPDGGDDECQHGLCYGNVCTRPCGGFGADCQDVGSNFTCQLRDLFYGPASFSGFICAVAP
jgi:hypothetical protein